MFKSIGILAGGIFIGAVGAEIVRRTCPSGFATGLWAKVGDMTGAARDAFVDGYQGAVQDSETSAAQA